MKNPEQEEHELRIRPRETETVSLKVPRDTLASLDRVAAHRDMSRHALLKLYVGQGLRQDLSRQYAERVMATAATVLARHLESREEASEILREIQAESSF
ncbi:MAG: hypothetical protein GY719_01985 [bacterium]|nr:hypothetical protein [bacterium]